MIQQNLVENENNAQTENVENILEVKNLTVMMRNMFLVKNVSFTMKKGECLGIVGENKSGKTSLIKAISGGLQISDGYVLLNGKDITVYPELVHKINVCLDPPSFFRHQTVKSNLEYLYFLSGHTQKNKVVEILKRFKLENKINTKVKDLSYFEKKLMSLALAFITKPTLLILDEPFKTLPEDLVTMVKHYINLVKQQGTHVIICGHKLEQIQDLCDRYLFMAERELKDILNNEQCEKLSQNQNFAFIWVKYPHYSGKLVMENYGLKVKILGHRILFEANEELTADIVRFLTQNKISIHRAGYFNRKAEEIFASLTPYFKEERE